MWDSPRELNAFAMVLTVLAALSLGYGVTSWVARRPSFEIREIVIVTPLAHTNAAELEAVIRDQFRGTFFTMNLDRARLALVRVPWVRSASLRRQWPHRLEVAIEEHVPLARWNDSALVNVQGEVFSAAARDALPHFIGPDSSAAEVTRRFQEWSPTVAALGLALDEVHLSDRGSWHLRVAGTAGPLDVELGREDPSAAVGRFADVYRRTVAVLARSGTRVEQVDLRYRNGFSARVPAFRERPQKKAA